MKGDVRYMDMDKALSLLVNYRRIYNEFQTMDKEDEEYKFAKTYIDTVNECFNSLENRPLPQNGFLEKSNLTVKQLKSLYIDVIWLSYLIPEKKSSTEIIEYVKEHYGLTFSFSRLTMLKKYATIFFATSI